MINIISGQSLTNKNTFHINVNSEYYCELDSIEQLPELVARREFKDSEILILGGGSNLLFTRDFSGLVIKNNIRGIEVVNETGNEIFVKVGAGENWHQFVLWCIDRNYGGVENLSLIPGNIGASPMQNIGAYGVEIKDVFYSLEAVHVESGQMITFNNHECEFGYRESVFKRRFKDQFIITSVTYRLNKYPRFNISYGTIAQELEQAGVKELSVKSISDAVIRIRKSKLPSPDEIGNAGSFFKNPEVTNATHRQLQEIFPDIVAYPLENGNVKLAAGWLIEKAGWKGYREGDAGVHTRQALVLVNYGNASGYQIFELSSKVMMSVEEKFGVILEREVNIY